MNQLELKKILNSSNNELIEVINNHIKNKTGNMSVIFLCVTVIVFKYKNIFHKLKDEMLPEIIVTLFLGIYNKKSITSSEIGTMIRSEIWNTFESNIYYTPNHNFDNHHDESEDGMEYKIYTKLLEDRYYQIIPLRLVPIIRFFLDTGHLMNKTLSEVDNFIVLFYIEKLGVEMNLDSDTIMKLIPTHPKEKGLFLTALANESPILFLLLMTSNNMSNVIRITDILGGKEIRIPTTEELVNTLEHISVNSRKVQTLDISGDFLSTFINNEPKSIQLHMSLLQFFNSILGKEFELFDKATDKLLDNKISPQMLLEINRELSKSLMLGDKLASRT